MHSYIWPFSSYQSSCKFLNAVKVEFIVKLNNLEGGKEFAIKRKEEKDCIFI